MPPPQDENLYARVREDIDHVLDRYLPETAHFSLGLSAEQFLMLRTAIYSLVFEDMNAFAERDEAAHRNSGRVYDRPNFRAVRDYRIANAIYYCDAIQERDLRESFGLRLTENSKREWGVEIQAAARIGRRFVLDHGNATVVGEMSEIGDDCYFLQNVILGAGSIGAPVSGRRHPRIGNHVTVAANAKILGAITVGDGAFIGPDCRITLPVPAGYRVTIVNQLQLTKNTSGHAPLQIDGLVFADDGSGTLELHGDRFDGINSVELVGDDLSPLASVTLNWRPVSSRKLTVRIGAIPGETSPEISEVRLLIRYSNDSDYVIFKHSTALKRSLQSILSSSL
jgi:serine acetyltransferase